MSEVKKAPSRPTEVDSPASIREAMIERRKKSFDNFETDDMVLFSHVIAWLGYLAELDKEAEQEGENE